MRSTDANDHWSPRHLFSTLPFSAKSVNGSRGFVMEKVALLRRAKFAANDWQASGLQAQRRVDLRRL